MTKASNGLGMTVLIYSQSQPLQHALRAMLGAMGCPATPAAGSREEADEIFSTQVIDAIILGRDSDASDLAGTQLPIVDFKRPSRISELRSALEAACRPGSKTPAALAN